MGQSSSKGRSRRSETYKPDVEVVECLWFPDEKLPCRNWVLDGTCHRRHCNFAHVETSLSRFLQQFKTANKSIDIALYTITCNEISAAILDCHKRGVEVRIVTDDNQIRTAGSDILSLHAAGIPVRHDNSVVYHMHHKFAVFDKQVVATGSLNWTRQAVLHNQENMVILRGAAVAKQFEAEFERLWQRFRDNRL
uniref:Mitochondrial cardiolipin hydrolase n=1 Tax=Tetraselmis sp. GSL018 TaxID=582737 RepID=A0A061SHQ7_9CHLO